MDAYGSSARVHRYPQERHGRTTRRGRVDVAHAVVGSAGVIFTAWQHGINHLKLFGKYRDTFKPPAFGLSLAENEGVLQPETARSYEGGVKIRTLEGRVNLEASGF